MPTYQEKIPTIAKKKGVDLRSRAGDGRKTDLSLYLIFEIFLHNL